MLYIYDTDKHSYCADGLTCIPIINIIIYVCMRVCICMCVYACVYMYVCVCVCVYVCVSEWLSEWEVSQCVITISIKIERRLG